MKKLLLLLLLVGVNANGADKPIHSKAGLEGIAKDGMMVVVEDISRLDKTFDKKAIENQVKLRLKLAGIKIDNRQPSEFKENEYPSILYINLHPIEVGEIGLTGYYISIKAARSMTFDANGKTYRVFATELASTGRTQDKSELREGINASMDYFLLEYLKANPKKTEP